MGEGQEEGVDACGQNAMYLLPLESPWKCESNGTKGSMRRHLGAEQSRKQNGHFWRKCDGPYLYQFCTVPPAKIYVGKPFKAPLKWYIIHRNWPRGSHARHPAMAPSWWPLPWGRIFRLIFLPYSVAMHTEMYYSIHIYAMHISSSAGYPNRAPERGGREV